MRFRVFRVSMRTAIIVLRVAVRISPDPVRKALAHYPVLLDRFLAA